ncbi:MAG TPA: biotin/lipoyl-containing protein, partial [Thermoanaerobaculia bacterium]|nr:biotin/lipoyl-containing protein [Thermoanaerobaculia bacterium]
MATEVVMPQMGESIAEGTITRWLVKVGDKVERDQPLFEISTDKVDAEIPSPAAGTLTEVRHKEGETVPVNQVVALIGEAGEQAGAAPAAAPAPAAAATAEPVKGSAEMETITSDTQQAKQEEKARGDAGPPPPTVSSPEPQPQSKADASDAAQGMREQSVQRDSGETAQARQATDAEDRLRKFSSPLVRNIAAQEGVNLEEVQGTGGHGRVTKDDILGHLEQRKSQPAPAAAAPQPAAAAPAPAPAQAAAAAPAQRPTGGFHVAAYHEGENVEIEPMSKIRQITAAHMTYSKATSAHVTTIFEMDLSRVARARARAK